MEKVTVVATYGDRSIRSARMEFKLPSVIALKVGLLVSPYYELLNVSVVIGLNHLSGLGFWRVYQ